MSETGKEQIRLATELRSKFFFHWSLLAGATLGLIFPFVGSLLEIGAEIINRGLLVRGIILLLLSLLMSSFRNLLAAKYLWKVGVINIEQKMSPSEITSTMNRIFYSQKIVEYIAIFSYIFGLILLLIFLLENIKAYI